MTDNGADEPAPNDNRTDDVTFTINVTPVNDIPEFSKGADQNIQEDAGEQTVPAWASNIGPGGGSDEDSQTLTFTVTADDPALFSVKPAIDVATGTLTYTPKNNAFGSTQVTVVLSDDGGTANGGVDSRTRTFNINITSVNDMPSINGPFNITVREGAPIDSLLETLVGTDADIGTDPDESLTYEIVSGDDNNDFALDATSGEFTIAKELDFETTEEDYTVTVRVVDADGASASTTITINVINENDNAPVAVADSYGVNEGATLNVLVGDGVLDNDSDADGDLDVLTAVLVSDVSYGELTLNADGSFTYTHDDSENFTDSFTYRVTDGSRNSNLVTVTIDITPLNDNSPILQPLGSVDVSESAAVSTLIATASASDADGDAITYAIAGGNSEGKFAIDPSSGEITLIDALDYETTVSYTLTIEATAGGETVSDDLTVHVLNENDNAPELRDTTFTITEITDIGTVIGTILASDADGNPLTWSVSANSKIEILSTGGVRTLELFDYESDSVYTYTVTVDDGLYNVSATLTILVTDVDEIPEIAIGPYYVDENSPAGTLIDSIILVNGVITGTVDFLKVADTTGAEDDGDWFTIDAVTGEIFVAPGASLDYETDSLLTIWAVGTNIHGTSVAQEIQIGLRNVNEPPVIAAQDLDLQENSAVGTVIGQVVSSDPENNQSYSLLPGSDARLVISSDGELTLGSGTVDYETETTITVGVIVDDGEFADTAIVTINILDVNEAPVIASNQLPVLENSPGGTEVGSLTATDPEGQPLIWTVVENTFVEITPDGLVTVKEGANLDYESGVNPVFQAIVTDGVKSDTAIVTLVVGDENEPPVVVTDTLTVPENSEEGTVVGQVEAVDPDSGDVLTYEIVGETPFVISTDGEIIVGSDAVLDYESTPFIEVVVQVTDSQGIEVTDTLIVSLENSIEVSKVEIVTVTSEDTTWTRPDTIRTNADELEITWEKDGNSTTDTEILEGDGKILVIRKWKDPSADLIGADTVVVLVNRENPTIRYPFEEPEIPEDRYLIVEKSPGSSDLEADTADGQLVWPDPIVPDTIGGTRVVFVHSEDTVLSAIAKYIDENLEEAESVIEIQPSLKEFANGKPVLNVVTFEYTDPYGNTVQETLYVVLDKSPPVVEIINPADSSETRTYVIDVDWTVDGRPMDNLLQESLQEGENLVIRSYMDRAGNIGSDTVFVTLIARKKYVLVNMEEPLTTMDQRRVQEMYALNPPEKGERFALSVYNVMDSREEELLYGHGSAVKEAQGEEPYPGLRGQHLGPTLRMEIKVPHIGGYDAAGEPRGGDIRSMVDSHGMVVVPSLAGSSASDGFDTIPVDQYVRDFCDEDAFAGLSNQELLDAGLMNTEILVSLNVYDIIGQFVDRITLRQEVSNVAYISDGGLVTFYLEMKPDESGKIRNQDGRSFGTGAYILNGYVRSVSTGLCDTPDMRRGERQDRKENVGTKFGYRRD
jgi:VCBS repeat-containing protein